MLSDLRKHFRKMGAALAFASCALAFMFGMSMKSNFILALLVSSVLVIAAAGSAYIWPFVHDAYKRQEYTMCAMLLVFGILFTGTDLTTAFGSIARNKTADIQSAKVQQTRLTNHSEEVTDDKALMAVMMKRLEELTSANAWSATVTAAALRAELPTHNEAIRQEEKRGGCGPKCLALKKAKSDVEAKIAIVEERVNLENQIKATRNVLEKHRHVVNTTDRPESAAASQNWQLASFFTFSLEPSEEAQHWTDKAISWLIAAFCCFGAIGANLIGYGTGKPSTRASYPQHDVGAGTSPALNGAAVSGPSVPVMAAPTHYGSEPVHHQMSLELTQAQPVHQGQIVPANRAPAEPSSNGIPAPTRRITYVREGAFARRVADIAARLSGGGHVPA